MSEKKKGRRHSLLLYKRSLDQKWMPIFPIGLIIAAGVWFSGKYWSGIGYIPPVPDPYDIILIVIALIIFAYTGFALLTRGMAYVQPRADHIRLVTPFLTIKISYRRVRRVLTSNMTRIFPPEKVKGSLRKLLSPYYDHTAIILELKGYPISPALLRFVLGSYIFHPETEGLVFMVPDWMALSTEIDSFRGVWGQAQTRTGANSSQTYKLLESLRKK
jgi:hypothetical protein